MWAPPPTIGLYFSFHQLQSSWINQICAQLCPTLYDPMDCSPLGKNTGVGCHSLFRGSSRPRGWTHISWVSCVGRPFFTNCATWEAFISLGNACWSPLTAKPTSLLIPNIHIGERASRGRGYMYNYGWVMLKDRNQHNTVKLKKNKKMHICCRNLVKQKIAYIKTTMIQSSSDS